MKRYWFEFDFSNYENPPYGLIIGCGVTGYEYNDVIQLLKDKVFYGRDLPGITISLIFPKFPTNQ